MSSTGDGEVHGRGTGAEGVRKGPPATSPAPSRGRARWGFVCGAIERAAGREVRSCTGPLHAANWYDPLRRICKRE